MSVRDGENDGPYESYDEDGQLWEKGTYNMSERCGEWIEDGETVTYDSCPSPVPSQGGLFSDYFSDTVSLAPPDLEDGN